MNNEKKTTNEQEELPVGLAFSMAMHPKAMERFSTMTPEQKHRVVTESKLAQSKDEMSQLVDRIATDSWQ
ncbi:MAG: hypothetical protein ACI4HI_01290 [Lachnospiraceae bacterium]